MYSSASKLNSSVQVGNKVASSEAIGWTSALLEVWKHPNVIEDYSTFPTPDQFLVVTSSGRYYLESFSRGAWKTAEKIPGMVGAIAPMNTSRLRLRSMSSDPIVSYQMYVPAEFVQEAARSTVAQAGGSPRNHLTS